MDEAPGVTPRVSFVVPTYNYAAYVTQAVDGLLGQTFKSLEVIVVDDYSTDDTPRVLSRYADNPRVRLVRHEGNQGATRSWNEGLSLARGEFIGIFDADDFVLRPDAVARQVELFDADPEVGLVFAACHHVDEVGEAFCLHQPSPVDYVRNGLDEFASLIFGNYFQHSGTLVRRDRAAEVGGYDANLPHASDWDRWLRLTARNKVAYIAEPLFAYRVHRANMSHSSVTAGQVNGELVDTVRKAFAALPPTAPASIRQLRAKALRRALLVTPTYDCSVGRARRGWQGLSDALHRSPGLVVRPEFLSAFARLTVLTLVGRTSYSRLAAWRARSRLDTANSAAG